MKHLAQNGCTPSSFHPMDLDALKAGKGVPEQYESCQTGVTRDGYVFQGHVQFMHQFLASRPSHARGLSVPGMPLGSPGMESDDFFMPYKIMLLKDDGTVEVYSEIRKASLGAVVPREQMDHLRVHAILPSRDSPPTGASAGPCAPPAAPGRMPAAV